MALTETDKKRWAHIDEVLAEHKAELQAATTHTPLREFATAQGWDNRSDFSKFKHSLRKLGIDYNQLREDATAEQEYQLADKAEALAEDIDEMEVLEVSTAALEDESTGQASYAITDAAGAALWYGKFFDDDRTRTAGDLVSAEQSVAEKAVFLASKVKQDAGLNRLHVAITTTCPDLDTRALAARGARDDVAVTVTVDDDDTRALDIAELPGYQRWKDNDLAGLISTDQEDDDDE